MTGSWTGMSEQERVRVVVKTLQGPTPVQEIADHAEVSTQVATAELDHLISEGLVITNRVRGQTVYDVNDGFLFNEMVQELVEENSQKELESQLEQIAAERKEITEEFSESDLQDNPNVQSTLDAIETESELIRHALRRYKQLT